MFNHQSLAQISLGLSLTLALASPGRSQIIPNGAGTLVNPQGNQLNITGGTQAGANLFHSFRDFNLTSAQIANFLSNPQTQNILARINGGNPSLINGLLQVTGGNSNLFLMNPSGIVFGQGASLNVPASFTATTANQIGLGNNQYFSATGNNNYAALTGSPDSFLFTTTQAGSIVNAGSLTVGNGQNISLIAGNTINTGRLSAPGGEIQVLALAGNRVRISQPGQVLSLEIVPPVDGTLKAVDLPALLTGSGELPGIAVNPSGQVEVAGTSLPNQQGIAVVSGRIDVSSATGNGGMVQVLGDRVAVLNSRINTNGATGGGTVRLGGEYLGGRDTAIAPSLRFNAQRTLVDRNSLISANATTTGEGGRVIVWADRNTGFFGRITARGATGRGGFVEVSGKENLAFDGQVNLSGFNGLGGTLLLDPANITIVAGANNSQADDAQVNVDATILSGDTPANMTISSGALAAIPATTTINIQASGNIDFQDNVSLLGGMGAAPVSFTAATISSGIFSLNTNGRNLTIVADSIFAPNLFIATNSLAFSPGNLQITATTGNLMLEGIATGYNSTGTGSSGSINLNALQGNISVIQLIDSSNFNNGNGGNINLNAPNSSITVGGINTPGRGASYTSGTININAGNLVRVTNQSFFCSSSISICSRGQIGASDGAVTIRHGGGVTTPFIVGDSSVNGTAFAIDAGNGNVINPTTTIPVPPDTYTQGIVRIITTVPVVLPVASPTISPELLTLLRNPAPPPTPDPVIVGSPSEPTAIEVISSLDPVVIPTPVSSPVVVANPVFTPISTPIPIPQPVPSPIAVTSPNSPTPSPLALASPLGIARPGNLDATTPNVQPVLSNTQNCVVRSPYQGGISWGIQIIWGQQICSRETIQRECCNPGIIE